MGLSRLRLRLGRSRSCGLPGAAPAVRPGRTFTVTGLILHLTHLHLHLSQFFSSFCFERFRLLRPDSPAFLKGHLFRLQVLVFGAVVMDQNQARQGLIAHLAAAPQVEEPAKAHQLLPLA